VTEGPYRVDEKLFRSDIRTDPSNGRGARRFPVPTWIRRQQRDRERLQA